MKNLRHILCITVLSAAIFTGFMIAGSIPGLPLDTGTEAEAVTVTAPDTPDLVSVKSKAVRKALVTWSAVEEADGYEIRYKTGDDIRIRCVDEEEVSKIKDEDDDDLSITLKKLKGGEKYKIKIRSYRLKEDKTRLRSAWSEAKAVKIKHTKWTDLQDKYAEKKKVRQLIFVKYKGGSKAKLILYQKEIKDSETEETEETTTAAPKNSSAVKAETKSTTKSTTAAKGAAKSTTKSTTATKGAAKSTTAAGNESGEESPEVTWKKVLSCEAYVGQNGLDKAKEGDRKTPTGVYSLTCAFGIKKDPGSKMDYTRVNKNLYWCGDSHYYNQMVDIRKHPHKCTGEHLINYTKQYAYAMNISYNKKGVYGKGSAIFLHCFGYNNYTLGCVAVSEENMKTILKTCGDNTKICIYRK